MAQPPNIKFDLGNTIRETAELTKSLETLGSVAQNLFQNLGRLSSAFDSQLQGVGRAAADMTSGQAPIAPSDYNTPTGGASQAAFDQKKLAQEDLYRKTAEAIEAGQAVEDRGTYRLKGTDTGGTRMSSLMGIENFNALKAAKEREAAFIGPKQDKSMQAIRSSLSGRQGLSGMARSAPTSEGQQYGPFERKTRSMDAIGISMADVTGVMKSGVTGERSGLTDDISKSIDKLGQQSLSASSENAAMMKETARILTSLKDSIRMSSESFSKASKNFSEVANLDPSSPKYQRAHSVLMDETGRLQRLTAEAESAQKNAKSMLPPGGEPPDFRTKMAGGAERFSGRVGAALGLGASIASGYLNAEQSLDQSTYGGRLRGEQAKAQTAQSAFQTNMEAADMTRAENLLKYRGNFLTGDEGRTFTGTKGLARAQALAGRMEGQLRGMQQRGRTIGVLGGATTFATGAVQTGAGAVAGAGGAGFGALGIGMAAQGVGSMTSGANQMAQSYFGNEFTALQGGLGRGIAGGIGRGMHGDRWKGLADDAQMAQMQISRARFMENTRALMDAEVKQRPGDVRALQEILDLEDAEEYGATLVGGDAMTKENVLGVYARGNQAAGLDAGNRRARQWYQKVDKFNKVAEAYKGKQDIDAARKAGDRLDRSDMSEFMGTTDQGMYYRGAKRKEVRSRDQIIRDATSRKIELYGEDAEKRYSQYQATLASNPEIVRDVHAETIRQKRESETGLLQNIISRSADISKMSDAVVKFQQNKNKDDLGNNYFGLTKEQQIQQSIDINNSSKEEQRKASDNINRKIMNNTTIMRNDLIRNPNLASEYGITPAAASRITDMTDTEYATGKRVFGEDWDEIIKSGPSKFKSQWSDFTAAIENPSKAISEIGRIRRSLPDTPFSRLQMDPKDFMMRSAELSNAMDASLNSEAGIGVTERAIRLSRSGMVGGFGQLTGNLAQISAVTGGGADNIQKLEKVLTSAISAGFDKSRMAQNFVKATLSLSQSMGTRSIESVAEKLKDASRFMGPRMGVSDEFSMKEAAKGIKSLDDLTKTKEGYFGSLKLQALSKAGFTLGSGFIAAQDLGDQDWGDVSRAYKEAKGDPTKFREFLKGSSVSKDAVKSGDFGYKSREPVSPDDLIEFSDAAKKKLVGSDKAAVAALAMLQNTWGKQLQINSAHRDEAKNESVGGAEGSRHLKGDAFDIQMSEKDQIEFGNMARRIGFKGIGIGGSRKGMVHIDMGALRSWGYTKGDKSHQRLVAGGRSTTTGARRAGAASGISGAGMLTIQAYETTVESYINQGYSEQEAERMAMELYGRAAAGVKGGVQGGVSRVVNTLLAGQAGKSIARLKAKVSRGETITDRERSRVLSQFATGARGTSLDPNATRLIGARVLRNEGLMSIDQANEIAGGDLDKKIEESTSLFENKGKIGLRKYLDNLVSNFAGKSGITGDGRTTNVDKGALESYFEEGGGTIKTSTGEYISRENLKGMSESEIQAAGISKLDLARAAEFELTKGQNVQAVRITNFSELDMSLRSLGIVDVNKRTTSQ